MSRPQKSRRVMAPPAYEGFKPRGIPARFLKKISLSLDEYESIRLADYEGMEHFEAAAKMGISRSVFTRLVEKARKKVAQALVEGCELQFERGSVEFQHEWYRCRECYTTFREDEVAEYCPECSSESLEHLNAFYPRQGNGQNGRRGGRGRLR